MGYRHPLTLIRIGLYLIAGACVWLLGLTFKGLVDTIRFH